MKEKVAESINFLPALHDLICMIENAALKGELTPNSPVSTPPPVRTSPSNRKDKTSSTGPAATIMDPRLVIAQSAKSIIKKLSDARALILDLDIDGDLDQIRAKNIVLERDLERVKAKHEKLASDWERCMREIPPINNNKMDIDS